jgi:hypothetical protein
MKRLFIALVAASALAGLASSSAAQAPKESDLKSEVPALTAMHEVISPMWHDAWPKKDTAALAGMAGKLEKHAAAITRAPLPGVLQDKTTAWSEGVAALSKSVSAFKVAADAKDDEALLKAAEQVHTDYEGLVKVIRPVMKEMEDFHASLYVLYHYTLKSNDGPKLLESVKALKPKMDALTAAVLPERYLPKQEAFIAQRLRLAKAVDDAISATAPGATDRLVEAVELVHIEYEKLDKVF